MQVKVFEADDMSSALKKVRETLGPDALILSTRTVRRKGLGLLGKPMTEITAAIDDATAIAANTNISSSKSSPTRSTKPTQAQNDDISYEDIWRNNKIDPSIKEIRERREYRESGNLSSIQEEIDSIKNLIQGFAREISDMSKAIATIQDSGQHTNLLPIDDDWLAPVAGALAGCGLQAEAAARIMKRAAEKLTPGQVNSRDDLDEFFAETITGLVHVDSPILRESNDQQRVALVGPTGVGKTTTIAKLAAAYLKKFGRRLALITIDTYRIAAVEQLKVYGEIMNLEVEVVMSPPQLKEVLCRHQDKNLLLIDTAGRSPMDDKSIEELADFLQPDLNIDSHLVLAATARERELHEAVKRFGIVNLKSFIFTKLDECESFGTLLNVHTRNNFPFSYLTDGQKVPEDLMIADPREIAGLIMSKPYQIRSRNAATA